MGLRVKSRTVDRVTSRYLITPNLGMDGRRSKFRPCIDLHNGQVKQIVGGTLSDDDPNSLKTNFVARYSSFPCSPTRYMLKLFDDCWTANLLLTMLSCTKNMDWKVDM